MFPPLCFVDESKAEVEYDKVEEEIEKQEKNKTLIIMILRLSLN